MGTYNPPTNITGFASLAKYVNAVTDGWFWTLILFALLIISFVSMKHHPSEKAFAGASFICALSAILMRALGLINDTFMFLFIFLAGVSVVMLINSTRQ